MEEARNKLNFYQNNTSIKKGNVNLSKEDKLTLAHMNYAQGLGASLRYANELRAVQQTGRLPSLKSSRLHEDVLRGNLGPGTGFKDMFGEPEDRDPFHSRI